mmetsp:Transcript_7362/g.13049  ORF Transcript_7362/g.13049 Transcript_7362/m.13049 type:complete len:495 (-) Transcript_7362:69-1553(-)
MAPTIRIVAASDSGEGCKVQPLQLSLSRENSPAPSFCGAMSDCGSDSTMGKTTTTPSTVDEDAGSRLSTPPLTPPQAHFGGPSVLPHGGLVGPQWPFFHGNPLEDLSTVSWQAGWQAALVAMQAEQARLHAVNSQRSAARNMCIAAEEPRKPQVLPQPMKIVQASHGQMRSPAGELAPAPLGSVLHNLANNATPTEGVAHIVTAPPKSFEVQKVGRKDGQSKSGKKAHLRTPEPTALKVAADQRPPLSPTTIAAPPGLEDICRIEPTIAAHTAQQMAILGSNVPSSGSALHGTGHCKPCVWFHKIEGCQNGAACQHCHLCPEGEIRARKKNARARKTHPEVAATGYMPGVEQTDACRFDPSAVPDVQGALTSSSDEGETTMGIPSTPSSVFDKIPSDGSGSCDAQQLQVTATSKAAHAGLETDLPAVEPPSIGSVLHSSGKCTPCAWFWKLQGCHNGADCRHCHSCPRGEIKARRKLRTAGKQQPESAEVADEE